MQQRCNSFGNGTDTERWFWEVVSQELTDLERSMVKMCFPFHPRSLVLIDSIIPVPFDPASFVLDW
jgi:hypothetical protein